MAEKTGHSTLEIEGELVSGVPDCFTSPPSRNLLFWMFMYISIILWHTVFISDCFWAFAALASTRLSPHMACKKLSHILLWSVTHPSHIAVNFRQVLQIHGGFNSLLFDMLVGFCNQAIISFRDFYQILHQRYRIDWFADFSDLYFPAAIS